MEMLFGGDELKEFKRDVMDFTDESYYWAEKNVRGRKLIFKTMDPLYAFAFLGVEDKVMEGMEKGYGIEKAGRGEMKRKEVRIYAKHPQIHYHDSEGKYAERKLSKEESEEEMVSLGNSAELVICKTGETDGAAGQYSESWQCMDVMLAAILGESKQLFLKGLEKYWFVDCGIRKTREAVCLCQNEEILSALMEKECTSFYLELEDALGYMNPILLRLIYERGGKPIDEDLYDKCLEVFIREYYETSSYRLQLYKMPPEDRVLTDEEVIKEIKPMEQPEWRTYRECVEDFVACMKYLKMQGGKRKKTALKKKLNLILEDMEKNMDSKLYQDFLEIVNGGKAYEER